MLTFADLLYLGIVKWLAGLVVVPSFFPLRNLDSLNEAGRMILEKTMAKKGHKGRDGWSEGAAKPGPFRDMLCQEANSP